MADDMIEQLRRASEGLVYPSESDAPFEPFRWDRRTAGTTTDQAVAKVAQRRPVRETTLGEFFAELEASEDGEQYTALRKTLEGCLRDVRVFRIGEINVDIYVVGKTATGGWAGLHTTSVET